MSESQTTSERPSAAPQRSRMPMVGCLLMLAGIGVTPVLARQVIDVPEGAGRVVVALVVDGLRLGFFIGIAMLVTGLLRNSRHGRAERRAAAGSSAQTGASAGQQVAPAADASRRGRVPIRKAHEDTPSPRRQTVALHIEKELSLPRLCELLARCLGVRVEEMSASTATPESVAHVHGHVFDEPPSEFPLSIDVHVPSHVALPEAHVLASQCAREFQVRCLTDLSDEHSEHDVPWAWCLADETGSVYRVLEVRPETPDGGFALDRATRECLDDIK